MKLYDYGPLPCEQCRQRVDTSQGLHECRQIDLLKRIDDLETIIKTSSDLQDKLLVKYVKRLEATIQAAIGVIDNWKVPLLDPDGKDSSEAVMRLLADDLRKVLEDE